MLIRQTLQLMCALPARHINASHKRTIVSSTSRRSHDLTHSLYGQSKTVEKAESSCARKAPSSIISSVKHHRVTETSYNPSNNDTAWWF